MNTSSFFQILRMQEILSTGKAGQGTGLVLHVVQVFVFGLCLDVELVYFVYGRLVFGLAGYRRILIRGNIV